MTASGFVSWSARLISSRRAKIAADERRALVDGAAMAFGQVVEDDDFVAFIEQQLDADAADITRPADDKNFHPRKVRRARAAVKRKSALELRGSDRLSWKGRRSSGGHAGFLARGEHFETFLGRAPFQNVDVDRAHSPFVHGETVGLIKVDRPRADEGAAVVVDLENFVGIRRSGTLSRAASATNRPRRSSRFCRRAGCRWRCGARRPRCGCRRSCGLCKCAWARG